MQAALAALFDNGQGIPAAHAIALIVNLVGKLANKKDAQPTNRPIIHRPVELRVRRLAWVKRPAIVTDRYRQPAVGDATAQVNMARRVLIAILDNICGY